MKTKSIYQEVIFEASPETVYEIIMDAGRHSELAGSEVEMSREIKGHFSVFDGYCTGYNVELVQGKKIVQAWHFAADGWPDDHYSQCTFEFEPHGTGCLLKFTQTDIPEHKSDALAEGWQTYYWEPMKEMIESEM